MYMYMYMYMYIHTHNCTYTYYMHLYTCTILSFLGGCFPSPLGSSHCDTLKAKSHLQYISEGKMLFKYTSKGKLFLPYFQRNVICAISVQRKVVCDTLSYSFSGTMAGDYQGKVLCHYTCWRRNKKVIKAIFWHKLFATCLRFYPFLLPQYSATFYVYIYICVCVYTYKWGNQCIQFHSCDSVYNLKEYIQQTYYIVVQFIQYNNIKLWGVSRSLVKWISYFPTWTMSPWAKTASWQSSPAKTNRNMVQSPQSSQIIKPSQTYLTFPNMFLQCFRNVSNVWSPKILQEVARLSPRKNMKCCCGSSFCQGSLIASTSAGPGRKTSIRSWVT